MSTADTGTADLYLVGLGLKPGHLTAQSMDVLGRSRRILYISPAPGIGELLRKFSSDVVDVSCYYTEGSDRLGTYKAMAAAALEAALEEPPVSLALYGHPTLLSLPSAICLRAGPKLGLRVQAMPAVSALDCLMADLGLDIVGTGVQMHEATDVLLYRRTLLPDIAAVIWQVGILGTRLHSGSVDSAADRLGELSSYLQQFYSSQHPTILIASAVTDDPPEIIESTIGKLTEVGELLTVATTLYIPPLSGGHVDTAVAQRLTDPAYLASITKPRDTPQSSP